MARTYDRRVGVMVLGTNFGALTAATDKFVIPKDDLPTYEPFTRYYGQKHRRSTIFANTSSQITTLIQYDDHNTLSLDEHLKEIGVSKGILRQTLPSFDHRQPLDQQEQDQYDLNPTEKKAGSPSVDEVRKDVIQPTIVRYVGSRSSPTIPY
ncbi:hypothetical protein FRB90_004823 [Tulasnella sp. 427]|nr:hypothetical protein FRB90_004823 [Tulasnella sp. 427]